MFQLLSFVFLLGNCLSAPVTNFYDQRQTGDLNVQVHLKDVRVVALVDSELLDDYTEYDYIYDYADFTVKPGKPIKTTTTTTTTTAATPTLTSGEKIEENPTTQGPPEKISSESTIGTTDSISQEMKNASLDLESDEEENRSDKRCKTGYSPDGKGRCHRLKRRRFSWIPLAMKISSRIDGNTKKD